MLATQLLNTEHGVFLTQLGVLRALLQRDASDAEIAAVVAAVAAPLHRHRVVEEKFLYPAIAADGGDDLAALEGMEAEHTSIDAHLTAIAAGDSVAEHAAALAGELAAHITREIHELFPLAERALGSERLESIGQQCLEHYHAAAGVAPRGER